MTPKTHFEHKQFSANIHLFNFGDKTLSSFATKKSTID